MSIRKAVNGCYTLIFFQIEECSTVQQWEPSFFHYLKIFCQNIGILRHCIGMVRNIGQLSDFQKQTKSKNKYNLIMLYTIYFFWLSLQTSASTTKNSSPSKQRQNSFPIQTTPVWISSADFWKTSSAHPALATWESKQFHRARW